MSYNSFGTLIELMFFALGLALYLFSSGLINMKGADPREVEKWRSENGRWLRPLSLALAAIMLANLILRLVK